MTEPVQPTPEQLAAVAQAQSPQEYAAAAAAAGLTGDAEQLAAAGAQPVAAPDFAEQVRALQEDNARQLEQLQASMQAQLDALRAGLPVPAGDPKTGVARNLSAGVGLLVSAYPNASRLQPLKEANAELAKAVAEPEPGAPAADPPSGDQIERVVTTLRRVIRANPQLETGILEHAAQIAEDTFGL